MATRSPRISRSTGPRSGPTSEVLVMRGASWQCSRPPVWPMSWPPCAGADPAFRHLCRLVTKTCTRHRGYCTDSFSAAAGPSPPLLPHWMTCSDSRASAAPRWPSFWPTSAGVSAMAGSSFGPGRAAGPRSPPIWPRGWSRSWPRTPLQISRPTTPCPSALRFGCPPLQACADS